MIVLGIDVGIKSLAMCVMTSDKEILYWDTVNLFGCNKECCGITVKGDTCGKNASLVHSGNYYCKTHCKEKSAKKYKEVNVKSINFQELVKVIMSGLENILVTNYSIFSTVTNVYIEFQPKINNKMKFSSHIIFGKFVEFYSRIENNETLVKFMTANKKTKLSRQPGFYTSCYKQRKNDSVAFIQDYIKSINPSTQDNDAWIEKFKVHKKKDDLADAMCYSLIGLG